jgi:hypothetical protein
VGGTDEVAQTPSPRKGLLSRLVAMRKRAFIAATAGMAIGYAVVLVRNLATPDILLATDFTVFWSAWQMILDGHAASLYNEGAQRAVQQLLMGGGYFEGGLMSFLNPPHFALATASFGWLAARAGEPAAFTAWTAVNLALLALLVRRLCQEWGADTKQHHVLLTLAIVGFYPVFVTVKNGQLSVILALGVLGVYRAANAARPLAAAAWLTVLTIKPQLVPVIVLYLAARREWRILATAAASFGAVVAITAIALGPGVWLAYVRQVHYLEQFWGSGTPDYMLNLRGALTRLFGLSHQPSIDSIAFAIWLVTMAICAAMLYRRRLDEEADPRPDFALLVGVGLLANPHLFIHDTVIWAVPLVLCAASMRDAGWQWHRFAWLALAWPFLCPVACAWDFRAGPYTWLDLHSWMFAATILMIGDYASRRTTIGSTRPADRAGRYDAATATISTDMPVAAKTLGSVGFTSFSIVRSSPVSSHAPNAPMPTPAAASMSPRPTTRLRTTD